MSEPLLNDRYSSIARRVLVLDPAVFARAPSRVVREFVDLLVAARRETVFALLGKEVPNGLVLPHADYAIADGGRAVLRHPHGEALEHWPPTDGPVSESHAVRHLAEVLMIPESAVHVVVGPRHAELLGLGGPAISVGIDPAPEGCTAITADHPEQINRGLQSLRLFLQPARRLNDVCDEAFERALDSLRRNITPAGFTAASLKDNRLLEHEENYAAVWSRDGIITGLWTLCLEEEDFHEGFRATLRTLARHQSPPGQIPANVRLRNDQPEYAGLGGIASIDSVLWFVIGVARCSIATRDRALAQELLPHADLAMRWLAAHDSNNDALLEIPEASDWMDLFPRSYNVLWDEVLWYQACLDYAALREGLGKDGEDWVANAERVRRRILEVFWPSGKQLLEIAGSSSGRFSAGEGYYLLSHVTPFDYSWRCDVGANLLAALTDILDDDQAERLFTFLWGVGSNSPYPVACLYPAVQSGADDWKDYFIVNFLNLPEHYHNGGIWPFIGGLWVRFLEKLGRRELAHHELSSLAEACRQGMHGEWEFNEWLHGRTGRPMGKRHQAWSAASYVKAYRTLTEETVPAAFERLDSTRLQ